MKCIPVGDTFLARCPHCDNATVDVYYDDQIDCDENQKYVDYKAATLDAECYSCGHIWVIDIGRRDG